MYLRRILSLIATFVGAVVLVVLIGIVLDSFSDTEELDESIPVVDSDTTTSTVAPETTTTTVDAAALGPWSDPAAVFRPPASQTPGLLTFRGNPTRTFAGLIYTRRTSMNHSLTVQIFAQHVSTWRICTWLTSATRNLAKLSLTQRTLVK